LVGRLRKLEEAAVHRFPEPTEPTEEGRRRRAAWEDLLATMAPEHARLASAWLRALLADEDRDTEADRLGCAAWDVVEHHLRDGEPLALPPEVAEVYLADREALAIHDCEDCGYRVPIRCGEQSVVNGRVVPVKSAVRYFERCPLCGGRTGYSAHFLKHGGGAPAGKERPPWRA
jgi:hypothetical protein